MQNTTLPPQKIFNLLILDESGSMDTIRDATIRSFNELVQTIQEAETASQNDDRQQHHFVTLYSFNSSGTREIFFQAPVSQAGLITRENYCPIAGTPLYDAMGYALLKHEAAIDGIPGTVTLVTILTDGEENASREFNSESIRALVERLKQKGWVFTYIGTDHDVSRFSANISIHSHVSYIKSGKGMESLMSAEKASRLNFYNKVKDPGFNSAAANEDYFEETDNEKV